MIQPEVGCMDRHIQEILSFCFTISHRIAVNSPCLSTCPSRVIRKSLTSSFMKYFSRLFVIIHYVIITVICTELILRSSFRMCISDICINRISCYFRSKIQKFQIHHIINDYRIKPFIYSVPRFSVIP